MINYKLITPDAKFGEANRKTPGSAGIDLYTVEDITFGNGTSIHLARTGVCLDMGDETNSYGRLAMYAMLVARSSLYMKYGVSLQSVGIIDNDYQGEILIPLKSSGDVTIPKGTAIAQLVFQHYVIPAMIEVKEFNKKTKRNTGGFGSTDI